MLSDVSQPESRELYDFTQIKVKITNEQEKQIDKNSGTDTRLVVIKGEGEGEREGGPVHGDGQRTGSGR